MHPQIRAAFGCIVFVLLAWLISTDRRRFPLKPVIGGLVLQFGLALFVLKTPTGADLFIWLGNLVNVVIHASDKGSEFVFGNLVNFNEKGWGFVFAAKALPNIIVFSSLSAIGYHLGLLQRVVAWMAWVMARVMGTSGAESLSAAANVFLGQTEAPLFVRPYIPRMTDSELNAVMISGFATIAGSLIVVYGQMLGHQDDKETAQIVTHLLAASLIATPGSLLIAKILIPEKELPDTAGNVRLPVERTTRNIIDAAATGALEGLTLALNVGAMLIAFIALVAILDSFLVWLGGLAFIHPAVNAVGIQQLNLDSLLGLLFAPVAWLIGLPNTDIRAFGSLLGKAMALNEFVAYKSLAEMKANNLLTPRSITLAVYALCGFANFSSIAIQVAGIGGMAPTRYKDLARLGLRAMIGGAITCWMTACVAGTML